MTSSDFDVLIDMGFEKERAELAIKQTGGRMISIALIGYLKLQVHLLIWT